MSDILTAEIEEVFLPTQFIKELKAILGMKIKEIIKYTDALFEDYDDCENFETPELYTKKYFEYIDWAGLFGVLKFDSDLVLVFSSDESLNSLTVRVKRNSNEKQTTETSISYNEKFLPFVLTSPDFIDPFWQSVVGAKVDAISLLKQEPKTVMYRHLPNEVGVIFKLDNQLKFAVVHNLSEHGVFSIIPESRILDQWRPGLKEIDIFDL